MRRFDVEPDQLVIVHDELDLPPAVLKVKVGGGLAGHNGLRSIEQHLQDRRVPARPHRRRQARRRRSSGADHVLNRFGKRDREQIDVTLEEAADAVELILTDGVDAAMNRTTPAPADPPLTRVRSATTAGSTTTRGRGSRPGYVDVRAHPSARTA